MTTSTLRTVIAKNAVKDASDAVTQAVKTIFGIIGPTTLLTGLLFYFGWQRTYSVFQYFGIDVTLLGFQTSDYLLRSVEAVYVPLGALLLAALIALGAHVLVLGLVARRWRPQVVATVAIALGVLGALLFARGLAGVLAPSRFGDFLVTPLCLGIGTIATAYGRWLWRRARQVARPVDPPRWFSAAYLWMIVGLLVLSLFWAASDYAQAYGRGRARLIAARLNDRPGVTVYSMDRLFLDAPGVVEEALPTEPGQGFRYRYRGLRLLIASQGRVFLLPDDWAESGGSTIVLDETDRLRVDYLSAQGP